MIKFNITRHAALNNEAAEVVANASPLRRVAHAIRHAPVEHRFISFLVFTAMWAVCEYVLHYEMAAKGVELFGMAPAADKVLRIFIGEEYPNRPLRGPP